MAIGWTIIETPNGLELLEVLGTIDQVASYECAKQLLKERLNKDISKRNDNMRLVERDTFLKTNRHPSVKAWQSGDLFLFAKNKSQAVRISGMKYTIFDSHFESLDGTWWYPLAKSGRTYLLLSQADSASRLSEPQCRDILREISTRQVANGGMPILDCDGNVLRLIYLCRYYGRGNPLVIAMDHSHAFLTEPRWTSKRLNSLEICGTEELEGREELGWDRRQQGISMAIVIHIRSKPTHKFSR